MRINGVSRLACKTKVAALAPNGEEITVEPMGNLPVIKDLVTDMAPFYEQAARADPLAGAGRGTSSRARVPGGEQARPVPLAVRGLHPVRRLLLSLSYRGHRQGLPGTRRPHQGVPLLLRPARPR